jgi:hypothetical protein
VTLTGYSSGSGVATFTTPLDHYHWGNATSTGHKYNGVDIRGEVVLLTRNVKIAGEDIQGWGGQIVTSSTVETDGTIRMGQVIMDNVEIYNCSQTNTLKAAFRVEGSIPGAVNASSLTNSAVHHGLGWGIHIINSAHVLIKDNVIFGFKPIGVGFQTINNVTFNDNIVADITERDDISGQMFVDKRGGVAACSLKNNDPCPRLTI